MVTEPFQTTPAANSTETVGSTDPRLDETLNLIGSNKIEGAKVERPTGEHIGDIRWLMIDKTSGHVAYVVMSFGGFFTIGESFYPIPWEKLKYDVSRDAYLLDISEEALHGAPQFTDETAYGWSSGEGRRVNDFYGVPTA